MGRVAVAHQRDWLDVRGRVVEQALCSEVVKPWLLGAELKTDKRKGLPLNQPDLWKHPESLRWVCQDLVINRGVACVHDLDGLVD